MSPIRLIPLTVLAAITLAACGSSSSGGSTPSSTTHTSSATAVSKSTSAAAAPAKSGSHVNVAITNYAFHPKKLVVTPGTRVTWTNQDNTAHTATANGGSFDTGTIEPKASKTVDFKKPGTYAYHCAFHAFMTATVTVK